jgi:hypothetical protein
MNNTSLIYFMTWLPVMGFCIKWLMDSWSHTSKTSNIYAISSIVQYTLMTLYLAVMVVFIGKFLHSNPTATIDLKCFFAALFFLLIVYVAIIALCAMYYPRLQYGYITPSISDTINNYIMISLWVLIFYNMHTLMECNKTNTCDPIISFLTLSIIAFGLMQVYVVVDSFRVMQLWPTDDIYFAPI